jgi:ABC-type branched-subunit amino acid transport system ATPase component
MFSGRNYTFLKHRMFLPKQPTILYMLLKSLQNLKNSHQQALLLVENTDTQCLRWKRKGSRMVKGKKRKEKKRKKRKRKKKKTSFDTLQIYNIT